MITNREIVSAAKKQLGIDLACASDAFDIDSNSVVEYRKNMTRRLFSEKDSFFEMASFGKAAVLSVNREIQVFCQRFAASEVGIRLFELPRLTEIERELNKYGYALGEFYDCFLPNINKFPWDIRREKIQVVEKEGIPELYGYEGFRNALQYSTDCLRPDVLATIMYDNGVMCGIAGASKDSETLWQIGIDVIPSMRNRGLGSALVAVLTKEILERGLVPYYGTWGANIASRRTALNCGYAPAWVGIYSTEIGQSREEAR